MGDYFNKGLYDSHIELKKTPFLEWESPLQLDKLVAEDVMNSSGSRLSYLYPITRVRSIERLLRTTVHSAFPIVTPVSAGAIPVFPQNIIKSDQVPQLYTRPSVLGTREPDTNRSRVRMRNPIPEEDVVFGGREELVTTYTIPANRNAPVTSTCTYTMDQYTIVYYILYQYTISIIRIL